MEMPASADNILFHRAPFLNVRKMDRNKIPTSSAESYLVAAANPVRIPAAKVQRGFCFRREIRMNIHAADNQNPAAAVNSPKWEKTTCNGITARNRAVHKPADLFS